MPAILANNHVVSIMVPITLNDVVSMIVPIIPNNPKNKIDLELRA